MQVLKDYVLTIAFIALSSFAVGCPAHSAEDKSQILTAVPFTNVTIEDEFWAPRLETNQKVSIPHAFKQCDETGRIRNFEKAAGKMKGKFEGTHFNDSDVYKIMEGAAYSLQVNPDPQLRKYLEDLIDTMAKAQWDDGYLFTFYSVPEKQPEKLWTNIQWIHELYCVGHMYEAAVAHYLQTGSKKFLDIATKNADLVCNVFGPGKRTDPPGHQEIEIGLCKLYQVTGDKKYLDQAKFFLDQRGRLGNRGPNGKGHLYGTYGQDHKPVTEQTKAVGHSVRAAYLYTGMADVAALTGNMEYIDAIDTIWKDVVTTKLYITGGIGAAGGNEGFGGEYELPNMTAYCETCASIANIFWNHRMFLMHADAKYINILERVLYNGALAGISMNGDRFFYPNPLESIGQHSRSAWFGCACCPSNVVRFIPSVPGYAYAYKDDNIYINLFIGGDATIKTKNNTVKITQQTNYPWDCNIKITVEPDKSDYFNIYVRIPGWAQNKPVPSNLYRYMNKSDKKVTLKVNDKSVTTEMYKGFACIQRKWKPGDIIELHLPMPIRRVLAHPNAEADEGKVALQRGPIVYCLEWPDNDRKVLNLVIPDNAELKTEFKSDLLNGVQIITGKANVAKRDTKGTPIAGEEKQFVAIPYYAWAHRGRGEMTVWPARVPEAARPEPLPTIAYTSKLTASFVHVSLDSIKDQILPKSSSDASVLHLDFWPHKGTTEWVQYDFKKKEKVNRVKVYWFDDTGRGECRVPKSWRMLYKDGDQWKEVPNPSGYDVDKDKYHEVTFDPVETSTLRLEVQLQPKLSTGIHEWSVE